MSDSDFKLTKFLQSLTKYSGITLRLAFGIIAGFFVGRYLDGIWKTEPILSVAGVLLGLITGLVFLYHEAMKEFKK